MKTETTKEVAKKAAALSTHIDPFAMAPTDTPDIDPADILLPNILLMQGPSKFVAEGKFVIGDIINSVTEEKIGDKKKGITFAPIKKFKTMTVMKFDGTMFVFDRALPWTPELAQKPFEETVNGTKYKNYPTLNFYIMLEEDLKKPSALPSVIKFKSTSLKAGKALVNHWAQAADIGKKPFSGMLTLSCSSQTKNNKNYHVFDVKFAKDTPIEYAEKLLRWEKILMTEKLKVDSNEDAEVSHTETDVTASSQF